VVVVLNRRHIYNEYCNTLQIMSNCLVFERDDDDEGLLVDSERSCGGDNEGLW
jgi:hypothetical protein